MRSLYVYGQFGFPKLTEHQLTNGNARDNSAHDHVAQPTETISACSSAGFSPPRLS